MNDVLSRIGEIGIVPVIKLESADKAVPLGKALVSGGIPVAEVTFRTQAAAASIRAMRAELPGLLVGAGTVLSIEQAEAALAAGAEFIVSPSFNPSVVDWCLSRDIPVIPGISGPEGIERGMERGLEVLKFFPAEASGGVPMLDALAGPYGQLRFVPTGGIDASNIGAYARRPQVHAIGGSWMVKTELVEAGDWAGIERLCREGLWALHGFDLAHVGINSEDASEAAKVAALFASLFGFPVKEGNSSSFASDAIEVMKSPFRGEKGHLAIRCNDVERALSMLRDAGVTGVPGTEKREKGRIRTIYLDLEIGGFAVHLLRA